MEKVKIQPKLDESDLYILGVLSNAGTPCYGLEILNRINELSDGAFEIKQPTLYAKIKSLINIGLLEIADGDAKSRGGKRNNIQITEKGEEILKYERGIWEIERTIKDRLISNRTVDLKNLPEIGEVELSRPLNKGNYYFIDDNTSKSPTPPKDAQPQNAQSSANPQKSEADTRFIDRNVTQASQKSTNQQATAHTDPSKRDLAEYKFCLAADGYTVKTYSKSGATAYYQSNYITFPKIIRDVSLLLFLSVVIEILAFMLFAGKSVYPPSVYVTAVLCSTLAPTGGIVYSFSAKSSIRKNKFTFSTAIISSVLAYLLGVGLSLLIMTLAGGKIDFENPKTYLPMIFFLNIPLSVCYYAVLLGSKKYNIKN